MNLGNAAGGGGGPAKKFSFKKSLNVGAAEFVPGGGSSWGAPAQPVQQQPYYNNQQGYYQQEPSYQQAYQAPQQMPYFAPQKSQGPSIPYIPPKAKTESKPAAAAAAAKPAAPAKSPSVPAVASKESSPVASPKTAPKKVAEKKHASAAIEKKTIVSDEPEEEVDMTNVKENVNILFMGHVDAGKSTMGGHILYVN